MIPIPDPFRLLPRRMPGRGFGSGALIGLAAYSSIVFLEVGAIIILDLAWWAALLVFFGLVVIVAAAIEYLPSWLCGVIFGVLYGVGIYWLFSYSHSPGLVAVIACVVGGVLILDGVRAR